MKYNSSSLGISIINNGKDRYISNGKENSKVKKNYSRNNIRHYESCWNSKSNASFNSKILNTDPNGTNLGLQQIDVDNSCLVQSLMESSYTHQIVADFAELDECYYRDGVL